MIDLIRSLAIPTKKIALQKAIFTNNHFGDGLLTQD
jgi:hypothetical protein